MKNTNILEINEQAGKILNCVRFDRGSANFPFPEEVLPFIDEVREEIADRYFGYAPVGGTHALKEQIRRLEEESGRNVVTDDIVINHGGMSGIFTMLGAVTKPGDEVITNEYYFDGFSLAAEYFQLIHRKVSFADQEALPRAVTGKTKVIILNSPENPTGRAYTKAEVDEIVRLAKEQNILILSDEVTNKIIYKDTECASPSLDGGNVVAVNSFSKNWFIPGIRVGWSVSKNSKINAEMKRSLLIQSGGVNLFGQLLMEKVLANLDKDRFPSSRLAILSQRRDTMKKALDEAGIGYLHDVRGGMNFYVDLRQDTSEAADRLLREHALAFIPGNFFEGRPSHYARLGFGAVSEEEIIRGIRILADLR